MKKILLTIVALCCLGIGYARQDKKFLTTTYSKDFLDKNLLSQADFHPFPVYGDEVWGKVNDSIRNTFIKQGESLLGQKWEAVPATDFLRFRKDGNRSEYEKHLFGRRDILIKLVVAELFEHQGRFMPDIINGVWAVCEESWWGTSAHYGPNLPDIARVQDVDLFQAETASMMAIINYLMREPFDKVSPLISKRISSEVKRKMLNPCMSQIFWWMNAGMNWNPWITSNWIYCLLLEEPDAQKRTAVTRRIFTTLDAFIDSYAEDGGCDEGPGYWGHAAGSLFIGLDALERASENKINIFNQPKIKAMGNFISKTYIGNRYYVNFADAQTYYTPDPALVYRFGKAIEDPEMMGFAAFHAQQKDFFQTLTAHYNRPYLGGMCRMLHFFLLSNEFMEEKPQELLKRDSWMPDLNVFTARSKANTVDGLFVAAKGGHNAEAHNHNDVGNFVVYADGNPLIIDMGVGTYERRTFNNERYTIWTMQSGYHNTATINGVTQKDGRKFAARDVYYKANDKTVNFSLEMAAAYPEAAKVNSWKRSLLFTRGKQLEVNDQYDLKEYIAPSSVQLMTTADVAEIQPGKLKLTLRSGKSYTVQYNTASCKADVEPIEITDPVLIRNWGDKVTRIKLISKSNSRKSVIKYCVK